MENTRSRMRILLLVITSMLIFPKMGHATENNIAKLVIGAFLATITHHAEKQINDSEHARRVEDRLFNRGYCATGFSLCVARNVAGIIASNYICKKMAEVVDRTIGNEHKKIYDTVTLFAVIPAILFDLRRHITPYENNENFSGLRASCEAYWQKWNKKIINDNKAWENRKRID